MVCTISPTGCRAEGGSNQLSSRAWPGHLPILLPVDRLSHGPCSPSQDLLAYRCKQALPSARVYSKRNSTNKVYFLLTRVEKIQHNMSIFSLSSDGGFTEDAWLSPSCYFLCPGAGQSPHWQHLRTGHQNESNCSMTAESLEERKCVTSAKGNEK